MSHPSDQPKPTGEWNEWRELLRDGRQRALCWNCGYPELIGSDDCRNCGNNFAESNRITVGAAATKPLVDALKDTIKYLEQSDTAEDSILLQTINAALAKVKEGK